MQTDITDDVAFTPETLRDYAKRVEDLRHHFLFSLDDAGSDPFAEQHYLVALANLELAQRAFSLAALAQSRAISGRWQDEVKPNCLIEAVYSRGMAVYK